MDMFGNGYTGEAPSEADIMAELGEEVSSDTEATENSAEQPQEQTEATASDAAPETAQQQEGAPVLPAPETVQPEVVAADRYKSLQTAYQNEKEAHKQVVAQLEQLRATLASQGKVLSADEQKEFADLLLTNPGAALNKYMGEQIRNEALKQVQSIVGPMQQELRLQKVAAEMVRANQALEAEYPQLSDPKERVKLLSTMRDLSVSGNGDEHSWTNNPTLFLQMAALKLYGYPKRVDQATVDQVEAQAKAGALAELSAKDAAKAGKAAADFAAPAENMSEEDKIFAEIASVRSGGVFN